MSLRRFIVPAISFFIPLFLPFDAQAATATVELLNGDTLTGELTQQSDKQIMLSHPVLGELTLHTSQVLHLAVENQSPASEQDEFALDNSVEQVAKQDNGLFGTGILTNWKRRVDLGIAGSAGKSRNHQVNVGFSADYDSDYTRIAHKLAYFRAKSEDELSAHSAYASVNRDWLRPETPWFHFAGGRSDWDQFKDWDVRVNGNAGVGYEFAKTNTWLLLGRTGLGFNQTFGGEREEFTPEGLLGIETQWDMNDHQHIEFANTLYPSLKNMSEYRNLTAFDWILDLNSYVGVALKLGLLNEYDSATEQGISKNDFKYTVSLAWKL